MTSMVSKDVEAGQTSKATSPLVGHVRTVSVPAGIFNLCKSAVGVGILALPFAMSQAGLGLGLLLLAFGAVTTSSTLHFLSRIAANTDVGDYFVAGRMAFGAAGETAAVFATLLFLFGGLIAYASISSFYFSAFLKFVLNFAQDAKDVPLYMNTKVITVVAALLIFPLALLRDLSKLAPASMAGMACMGAVCALTVADYFVSSSESARAKITMFKLSFDAIKAFCTILFAFCNHFTMLSIVPNMVDPTPQRRRTLLLGSSSVVFAFYALVALFGYLHFGDGVNKNILLAKTPANMYYAVAQLLVGIVIVLSYPLLCDPARSCVEFLLTRTGSAPATAAAKQVRNLAVTSSLVAGSALVAMFAGHVVLPILGAFTSLCGSLLMFIFPSMYFLRLSYKYSVSRLERAVAYFDIAVGAVLLVVGTYLNGTETIQELFGNSA